MHDRFHKWVLHEVVQETEDAMTFFFDTEGQYFNFKAGQFINITHCINGENITRSYSLSSSPNENYPSITIKRVKDGIMSNYLFNNAQKIENWEIEGPYGNFVLEESLNKTTKLCFMGGGSGITPLFSMMKALIENVNSPYHLIYANRNHQDIIFKSQIESLVKDGKASVFHALTGDESSEAFSEELYKGRLTRLIVKKIIRQKFEDPLNVLYFICGPEKLMEVYNEALQAIGVPEEQIFQENFSIENEKAEEFFLPNEPHEVLMHVYESTALVDVKAGQSILQAALENGLPVKYSCQNGTCGTCWAKYSDGEVRMLKNYALTKEEVDENYILLCQSYPMNDSLTVHVG